MANAILMIVRPLLVSMLFSVVKGILKAALNTVDLWMRKKVESTDNKYDDETYKVFSDNKDGIIDALDRVISLIAGGK